MKVDKLLALLAHKTPHRYLATWRERTAASWGIDIGGHLRSLSARLIVQDIQRRVSLEQERRHRRVLHDWQRRAARRTLAAARSQFTGQLMERVEEMREMERQLSVQMHEESIDQQLAEIHGANAKKGAALRRLRLVFTRRFREGSERGVMNALGDWRASVLRDAARKLTTRLEEQTAGHLASLRQMGQQQVGLQKVCGILPILKSGNLYTRTAFFNLDLDSGAPGGDGRPARQGTGPGVPHV